MSSPNYAGNIIVILANLPDFLRTPILKKRMIEFFAMSEPEKDEIITNALEAGPTIPFPNFAKLFKTWLEVLTTISDEQRTLIFSKYIGKITQNPEKLILFNLDGIFEIFNSLDTSKKEIISNTIRNIIQGTNEDAKRKLLLVIPEAAKTQIGI